MSACSRKGRVLRRGGCLLRVTPRTPGEATLVLCTLQRNSRRSTDGRALRERPGASPWQQRPPGLARWRDSLALVAATALACQRRGRCPPRRPPRPNAATSAAVACTVAAVVATDHCCRCCGHGRQGCHLDFGDRLRWGSPVPARCLDRHSQARIRPPVTFPFLPHQRRGARRPERRQRQVHTSAVWDTPWNSAAGGGGCGQPPPTACAAPSASHPPTPLLRALSGGRDHGHRDHNF